MKKYLATFMFALLLFGCQSQSSENLHSDAESVYSILKTNFSNKTSLTNSEKKEVESFKENYINNYKKYESDKELLSDIETLINSYKFYYVSVGLKKDEDTTMYKERFEQSLSNLDKQFNK